LAWRALARWTLAESTSAALEEDEELGMVPDRARPNGGARWQRNRAGMEP
jgi:hypothetical protein